MKRAKSVDEYIRTSEHFRPELRRLRTILRKTDLDETVKWGGPCYTWNGKNVVGLGSFKSYVGLWFFQGAQLKDRQKKLVNAQEGKTKAQRQWRFQSMDEIDADLVRAYVDEAIEIERTGRALKPARAKAVDVPPELAAAMKKKAKLRAAFGKLTPGRQREYAEYIASAKRDATRASRVEKIVPMIEKGVGLNDKYRDC